jgi:PST family polysaccharide transporter
MIANRFVQISVLRQIANIWRSLVAVAVMVLGIAVLKTVLPSAGLTQPIQAAQLALLIVTGIVLYFGTHLGLWLAAKRPDGAEQFLFNLIQRRGIR